MSTVSRRVAQEFYKDEWIPVILPHDRDASSPSPMDIAKLFQKAQIYINAAGWCIGLPCCGVFPRHTLTYIDIMMGVPEK